jgi:16S rRNA C1402 (ribose-2'-O) methylase RsmI
MSASFGAAREAAVVREISKTFEECVRGTLAELHARFSAAEPRGEIVVVVGGAPALARSGHSAPSATGAEADGAAAERIPITVEELRDAGLSLEDASALVATVDGGGITVESLRGAGMSLKGASAVVARLTGTRRREVYQQALARRARNPR